MGRIVGPWATVYILQAGSPPLTSPLLPHDSGPIQWARGDVGLKPIAAARPQLLMEKRKERVLMC